MCKKLLFNSTRQFEKQKDFFDEIFAQKVVLKYFPNIFNVKINSSAHLKNLEFGPLSLTYSLILYAVGGVRREGGNVYKSGA